MRNTSVIVGIIFIVLSSAISAGAQCGDRTGEWAYGPTDGAAGNGTTAVFGSGRVAQVADTSDPANPIVVADIVLEGQVRGVAVDGDHAFVAASQGGLVVIDISNPQNAYEAGAWPTDNMVINVTLDGQRAYVANLTDGLVILDVSDPTSPVELGTIDPGGYVWAVAIQGETAFVANSHDGLQVIDISDETNPQLLTTFAEAGECYGIDLSDDGNHAFVADYFEGLRVVDISDPSSPALVAFVDVYSYATDIKVEGNYAYLGNRGYGLRIYDISDPTNPTEVRQVDHDGSTQRVSLHEDHAYLANYDAGLRVIDIAVPSDAQELGFIGGRPELNGPDIEGSLAVIAGGSKIVVLDVSEPSDPVEVVTADFDGYARKTAIDGDVVYVADGSGGIEVLDLSDPENPLPLASVDFPNAYDVVLHDDFLFVGCDSDGLRVLDVSDPAAPVVIGTLEGIRIRPNALSHSNGTLFIREYDVGVHLVDVSDPSSPIEIGLIAGLEPLSRPAIQGNMLYVSNSGYGVHIFDITDLNSPTEIGQIYEARFAYGLAAVGQLLFIADLYDGSFVFDVANPAEPLVLAATPLATDNEGEISFDGPLVMVGEDRGGAEFFDLASCFSEAPAAVFTWSPNSPEAGRQVQLTDTSIGSIDSRQWSFDDGATSSERNPVHVWTQAGAYDVTLTVNGPMGSSSLTNTVTVQPRTGDVPPITEPGEFAYVIAAAAHAPGLEGTQWVTDVVLHNPGPGTAEAFLWFMKSGQDNLGALGVGVSVAPGASQQIEDLVLSMFAENEAAGAILIGSDSRLLVTSRTYNDASSGTYGQFIPGRDVRNGIAQDQSVHLIQLTRTDTFRTNLGIANPTADSVRVTVSLRNTEGNEINTRTLNVPPFGFMQRTDILGVDAEDAFAIVSSSTPGAAYFPYASVVDNRTGDPMMVEPIEPNDHFLVAAAAHVGGLEDTDWRTDLEIYNLNPTPANMQLKLLKSGEDNSSPPSVPMTLKPGACVRMADALNKVFSHEGTAALEVDSLSGNIVVSSRTFNTTDAGTFGQFLPGVGPGGSVTFGQEARIIQLTQDTSDDTGFRTNIGFVNRAPNTTRVETDLYTSDGVHLGTVTTRLDPFEHRQINRIFRQSTSAPVANGYAIVTTSSADGSFVAYASVVDNASGDPIFIPASLVPSGTVNFELLTTGAGGGGGAYGPDGDLNLACTSWFGQTAFVADWNDVVAMWAAAGEAFADEGWILSDHAYLLEKDGEGFRPDTDEHYLIARHDGELPPGFESLAQVGDHFIDLGSEEDVTLQVLCRRPVE
ncbi:MAG: PKD domain-containing protein [Acidobacteriota bacterium]